MTRPLSRPTRLRYGVALVLALTVVRCSVSEAGKGQGTQGVREQTGDVKGERR